MKRFLSEHRSFFLILFFFVVGVLLYLSLARQTGYYDDDWFAMYAAKIAGPQIFRDFYVLDSRPGRALVTLPQYMLFHGIPFYYALSAYFFRILRALTFLWLLRLLWPGNKRETFLAALFFLIYPGFPSMPAPIDFQIHLVGIWMAFLSLGLSIKSITTTSDTRWFMIWAGAVVTGLFYLAQMKYYIGFELIHVLLFLQIFLRKGRGWKQDVPAALTAWLPFAIIPILFFTWRLFLFESERKVTDAGLQLGRFTETPIHTSLAWLISQLAFNMDVYNSMVALGLSIIVLLLFLYFVPILNQGDKQGKGSGYEFVSAGGGVVFLVALIKLLPTLTHYANAVRLAEQMADIRPFWWQVSWRVPKFDRGTTILAHSQ